MTKFHPVTTSESILAAIHDELQQIRGLLEPSEPEPAELPAEPSPEPKKAPAKKTTAKPTRKTVTGQ